METSCVSRVLKNTKGFRMKEIFGLFKIGKTQEKIILNQ